MISAVLFDMGGTLDADGLHWLDRFYTIYERAGAAQIPRPQIKEAFYWADAQAELDAGMKSAGLRDMMDRHVRWQFQKLELQDPALETKISEAFWRPAERILRRNRHILEKLAFAGLKLGVISNFYGNVEVLCREFSYGAHLGVILDSAVCGLKKPDPAIFQMALDRLGVQARETAFVGDSFERDIVPAKSLGLSTVWLIGDSDKKPPRPDQTDVILHSLEELPNAIDDMRLNRTA